MPVFQALGDRVILKICDGHIYKMRVIRDWPIRKTIVKITTGIKIEENVKKKLPQNKFLEVIFRISMKLLHNTRALCK